MTYKYMLITTLLLSPVTAFAQVPDLQNTGPIIYLADNLDEADNLGYCIDTEDRGQTDRI